MLLFENQECISKIYNLRNSKLLSNKILLTYFNLSEPIHNVQFNVRYPVECIKRVEIAALEMKQMLLKRKMSKVGRSYHPLLKVS